MVDAVASATRFIQGRTRADLDTDEMLRFALIWAVGIVGEAATQVSPEGRAELGDLPWTSMIGMRNRLVHAYFDVDRNILWSTVTEALPGLSENVRRVLDKSL